MMFIIETKSKWDNTIVKFWNDKYVYKVHYDVGNILITHRAFPQNVLKEIDDKKKQRIGLYVQS